MRYPRFLFSVVAALVLSMAGLQPANAAFRDAGPASAHGSAPMEQGVTAPEPGPGEDRYIVMFDDGTDPADKAADLRHKGLSVGQTMSHAVKAAVVTATPGKAAELSRTDGVASVRRDERVTLSATQSPAPWNLDRIDQRSLPLSNSFTPAGTGAGVRVYVLDTGVRASHADFGGRVASGWSVFADSNGTADCNGHGTHVAGTIAGTKYGVAKSATIVPVRVLDCEGGGWTSDVIAGLDWVVGQHQGNTPAVANLSMSASGNDDLDVAVQAAINDGVTVTAAAGNSSTDACTISPARVPGVLTVAASDSFDGRASFSNTGPCIDVFAPGVQIESDWFTGDKDVHTLNGTSMASPHVAGTAALLLGGAPSLGPAQVASRLSAASTPGKITNAGNCTPNRLVFAGAGLLAAKDPEAGTFVPLAPCRQLDTRDGTGGFTGPVGPGQTINVKVTGRGGIPSGGVSAVAMNITVTSPSSNGFITAYAGGTPRPNASNVNYGPGQIIPNFAITPVGADGTINFTNISNGTVQLIADVSGYYPSGTPTAPGAFGAISPYRFMDTRVGTGGFTGPVGPGQTINVKVTDGDHIPSSGVSAVAMNITVTSPSSNGFITAYAGGTPRPNASNVNYGPGQIIPNFAITPVGADGTINFTNTSSGTVQLIADVSGYYLSGTTPTVVGGFGAISPYRFMDTRDGTGGFTGPVGPGQTINVKVTDGTRIPSSGVSAVAMNITVTSPTSNGFITAYAGGTPQPGTSNLNYAPGQIVPNFAITPVGVDGTINFTNTSSGTVQLIADVSGYFIGG